MFFVVPRNQKTPGWAQQMCQVCHVPSVPDGDGEDGDGEDGWLGGDDGDGDGGDGDGDGDDDSCGARESNHPSKTTARLGPTPQRTRARRAYKSSRPLPGNMSSRRAEHDDEIERCRTELQSLGRPRRPRHPSEPYTVDALTDYIEQLTKYMQSTRKGTEEKEDAIAELIEANRTLIHFVRRMPKQPAAGPSAGCG